jgi:2-methylcitrate dehydratase PrpD
MTNLTQELAKFVVETGFSDLPSNVVRDAKMLILDSIGCALAGITSDPGKMAVALAKRLGGPPEASIIGSNGKVSCTNAVLANGQLINTPDYDALMPGGHAPAYIIPPALAMAEVAEASGQDLILAAALGFEVSARVYSGLRTVSPTGGAQGFRWQDRQGYANCNFGAAAGAGKLLKLNEGKMTHALGLAAHMSQVLTWVRSSFSEHRPMTKYGVPGWQNTGGVMAALLADMGYMGDTTVFDPPDLGFWKFAGYEAWDGAKPGEGLGKNWVFARVNYKPYPCCRVLHPALEALVEIMQQNNLRPTDIEHIKAYLPRAVEAPLFQNRELTNIIDFQFGLPYVLAVNAYGIRVGVEWQDMDTLKSPEIRSFAQKVEVLVHPESATNPQLTCLEVTAKSRLFKGERTLPKGTAEGGQPMTDKDLETKFRHNAQRVLTLDQIEKSVEQLFDLEKVVRASDLMAQVSG